jgi:hypothetical protein
MSDPNPYESPKETSPQTIIKAGVGIGTLLLMTIPAGCICGGITCFSAGFVYQPPNMVNAYYLGWLLGIPIGLFIAVLVPLLAVLLFRRRVP